MPAETGPRSRAGPPKPRLRHGKIKGPGTGRLGMEGELMRKILRCGALLGCLLLAALLSGCSMPKLTLNSEDLYSLPTLPAQYTELNTLLNEILEGGAEYAAPTSGANIQAVQLVDLDGDGKEEAVAFFRNSAEEKPLKIYIFTETGDSYQQTNLIEGSGTGIYSIAYKQTDRILRGAKKADGTYEYESHVDYWMPFNGGIGLHDADWRGSFGGSIYKTNGSHGCINLPVDKAPALYELIEKGTPVICHN